MAGFIVGLVARGRLIDGSGIRPGDLLLGLPSSGLHTNGYSLARRIVFETLGLPVSARVEELGATVGEELLRPHRSYLRPVQRLLASGDVSVKGLAHITGGGLTDNLPRVLPPGTAACVNRGGWQAPPVFRFLQRAGNVPEDDMYRTFNMGIGMVAVVAPGQIDHAQAILADAGESGAAVIGEIIAGDREVIYRKS